MYDKKDLGGDVDVSGFQERMNAFGNDGWELVNGISTIRAYGSSKSIFCLFRRKKAESVLSIGDTGYRPSPVQKNQGAAAYNAAAPWRDCQKSVLET